MLIIPELGLGLEEAGPGGLETPTVISPVPDQNGCHNPQEKSPNDKENKT